MYNIYNIDIYNAQHHQSYVCVLPLVALTYIVLYTHYCTYYIIIITLLNLSLSNDVCVYALLPLAALTGADSGGGHEGAAVLGQPGQVPRHRRR
eukprot:COSAG06_NODE_33831_length_483_cov_1.950521_1_plen_93_part_01